jgi:hypothetical protein
MASEPGKAVLVTEPCTALLAMVVMLCVLAVGGTGPSLVWAMSGTKLAAWVIGGVLVGTPVTLARRPMALPDVMAFVPLGGASVMAGMAGMVPAWPPNSQLTAVSSRPWARAKASRL